MSTEAMAHHVVQAMPHGLNRGVVVAVGVRIAAA